jgi:exopolyphosphatase/guanosine-5'-triphosphate,3'-diphosphate pyrophosphatase
VTRPTKPPAPETIAAVDLGSNSFHLVVARVVGGLPQVVDRLRERVALGAGLDKHGALTDDVQERALAAIERFGQRLKTLGTADVRAVGTNALRQATNAREFLKRARSLLGHPIEVISGHEEARLIYQGVAHDLEGDRERRLVIDIGGGSTECIVGEGFTTLHMDSLYMGCVSWTQQFFRDGEIRKQGFAKAEMAARLEIEPVERRYRSLSWKHAIGSSGTILAIEELVRGEGGKAGITKKGLDRLRERLLDAGHVDELDLPGLKEDRAQVLPGGLAILRALFEGFGIQKMGVSQGALREGLLYDLLGRMRHEDVREQTIAAFAERFHVDPEHVAAVERTALALLEQVERTWGLKDEESRRLLVWAARLHEIGVTLSYTGHHKHGAYLVANSDMRGFSRNDQLRLAALIRNHRRRIDEDAYEGLSEAEAESTFRLTLLLRLAVRLNRSRSPRAAPAPRVTAGRRSLALVFPASWLAARPMTEADFAEEAAYIDEAGYELTYR